MIKKTIAVLASLLLFNCAFNSDNNESEYGYVVLLISAENNHHLFFNFPFDGIYLIDKHNNYRKITGNENYSVNLSRLKNHSEVLLKIKVPADTYYGIAVDTDLSKMQVKSIHDDKIITPVLHDGYGAEVKSQTVLYRVRSNFDSNGPLKILPNQVSSLSLMFDIDASTRILSVDEKANRNLLVMPVFHASTIVPFPNALQVTGTISAADSHSVSILPLKSKTSLDIPIDQETIIKVDGKEATLEQLIQAVGSGEKGIATGSFSLVSGVLLSYIDYFNEDNLYRFEGYISQKQFFFGSRETLSVKERSFDFIKKAIKDVDVRDAPLMVSGLTTKNTTLEMRDFKVNNLQLTGKVKTENTDDFEFSTLSINALDASLFFHDDEAVTVTSQQKIGVSNDLISLNGQFTGNVFQSMNTSFIDERQLRMMVTLPLSSESSLLASVKREALVIDEAYLNEYFSYLKISDEPIYQEMDESIKKIIIDLLPNHLVVIVNIDPYLYDILQLSDLSALISTLNGKTAEGFIINSAIADGYIEGDVFLAKSLVISVSIGVGELSNANLSGQMQPFSILKGAVVNTKKALFKMNNLLSKFSNYMEMNTNEIKKAKNVPLKPKIPGDWRLLRGTWVDMDAITRGNDARIFGEGVEAKDVSSSRKSSDLIRNIGLKNPDTGEFIARKINYFDKIEGGKNTTVSLSERLDKLSQIPFFKDLGDGVDAVKDFKTKLVLQDYISAVKSNDTEAVKKNMFHTHFSEGKNQSLLSMLMVDVPDNYDLKLNHRSINSLMIENDDSGMLKKLLRNNPEAYKQIYAAYEDVMVKSIFANEKSLSSMYQLTQSGDEKAKESFVSKLSKKITEGDTEKISGTFKKINSVIASSIKEQNISLDSPLDLTKQKALLSHIDKSIRSAAASVTADNTLKQYASSFDSEISTANKATKAMNTNMESLSMDKFSAEVFKAVKKNSVTTSGWGVEVVRPVTTVPNIDRYSPARQPKRR